MTRASLCRLAEGHTHHADGQDPCRGGEGPGTMDERVVLQGVPARLPGNSTSASAHESPRGAFRWGKPRFSKI